MKWLWRTLRRLFYLLRLVLWLALLALVCGYAFLHFVGVPRVLRVKIEQALARQGMAARFDRIYLELPASLVARNVALGDIRTPDHPVVQARRVALGFSFNNLLRGQLPSLSTLYLDGGELAVPVDFQDPKSERIEAQELNGRVRLREDNVLAVEQITADILGLHFSLQGNLKLSKPGGQPKPPPTPEERERRARLLHNIKAELAALKCERLPLLAAYFEADVDDLAAATATLKMETGRVAHPRLAVDRLSGRLRYENQTLQATNCTASLGAGTLNLNGYYDFKTAAGGASLLGTIDPKAALPLLPPAWQSRVAAWNYDQTPEIVSNSISFKQGELEVEKLDLKTAGGTLSISGTYDFNEVAADAWVESTMDLKQLTAFFPPGWQRNLKEWQWARNPVLKFSVFWSRYDPAHPIFSGGIILLEDTSYRGVGIRRGICRVELRNDTIWLTDAIIDKSEGGVIEGNYSCQLVRQDFVFTGLKCTVPPRSLEPLFSTNVVKVMREFTLAQPPVINGDWRGNWQQPASHQARGTFASGPMVWRGVRMDSFQSAFTYVVPTIQLKHVRLHRPEGKLDGEYQFNFDNSDFEAEVTGTLNLDAVRPVLSDVGRQLLDRYHPEGRIRLDLRNIRGNWQHLDQCYAEGKIQTGALIANTGRLKSASALFKVDPTTISVGKFSLQVPSGEVEGQLVHERQAQRLKLEVNKCAVLPMEIAELLGTNVAAAVSPFQFARPPTFRDIKAVVDFRRPEQTTWSARLIAPQVAWWKLQAGKLFTAVGYTNQVLTLSDFHADEFYGGRLLGGEGQFDLGKHPMRYKAGFRVENADGGLLLDSIFGYKQVQGALNGDAQAEGIFGDYNSIRGQGKIQISKGYLGSLPLFGRLSSALGRITKDKATSSIANPAATQAETTFRMAEGRVHLPASKDDRPTTVHAPPHLIIGRGQWHIGGELDFTVQVRLLRGNEFIHTITGPLELITGPLENILSEFKLTGTPANPQWRLAFLPRMPGLGGGAKPGAEPKPEPKK